MSIFTILDVISNSSPRNRLGGPGSLAGSQYNSNTYRFPLDIGNYDKGHYILFHVNEQTKTQFSNPQSSDIPTVLSNVANLMARRGATNIGQTTADVTAALKTEAGAAIASNSFAKTALATATSATNEFLDKAGSIGATVKSAGTQSANDFLTLNGKFLRTIQRTTDTVALYMPDSLQFTYAQTYDTPSMSNNPFSQGAAVASTVLDGSKINAQEVGKNLSPFFLNFVSRFLGNIGSSVFAAATGLVQNPMMEVLYTSPNLREFDFNFMFYPRSEKEALEVQKIIERFKFHQAPEIKANQGGFFLIPPSEFDIKFMYNGKENPNIDKISTCVLTSINIDYAKSGGFTAFEVAGENDPQLGRTGMPTGIAMALKFKETQILTKESYRGTDKEKPALSNVSIDEYSDNQFGTSPYGEANG
jgi:hypothetical protein